MFFRWKENSKQKWIGVLQDRLWVLHQDETRLFYEVIERDQVETEHGSEITTTAKEISCPTDSKERSLEIAGLNKCSNEQILTEYFQLDVNLIDLYSQWKDVDTNFKEKADSFSGVRMLRQDPVENLFSFICSSNNHISRISGMVERMCERFGEKVTTYDNTDYYSFPSVKALAGNTVEKQLRDLGFGYRAKYIHETAKYICKHQCDSWLFSLRNIPYKEAKKELMNLYGVGSKVSTYIFRQNYFRLAVKILCPIVVKLVFHACD